MSQENLAQFLDGSLSSLASLQDASVPTAGDLSTWTVFFERRLGLISVRASASTSNLRNYPLWIAEHPTAGPILIKYVPGLFNLQRVECLQLNSGQAFELDQNDEKQLEELRVLVEPFNSDQPMTPKRLADFVVRPIRGLMRTAMLHHVIVAMCGSVLFIVNFNLLSYAVPAQNMENFRATSWLVAGAIIILFLGLYTVQRIQFRLDSIMEERTEILKLSLLWALRPQYIISRGPARVEQLCTMVAQTGKAASQAKLAAISLITLVPIVFFMYLRLSPFLFIATGFIVILAGLFQLWFQLKAHNQQRQIAVQDAESDNYLYRILHSVTRLKFYGTIKQELDRWQDRQGKVIRARMRHSNSVTLGREIAPLASDLAQLLTFLLLSLMIAKLAKDSPAITVATAFITIHLVTQIHRAMPRVLAAFLLKGAIKMDLAAANDLLEEADEVRALNVPSVTRASASLECHRLRLPHGCRFKDQESLTIRFDGASVVQIGGDSGAGKTTFLSCMLGLQAPEAGSIEVFGVDPMRLTKNERRRIFSYLDQNVQLLPGTVRDNLKLFSLESAGDRSLWDALERVMLLDRVRALPLGLDTPIADARRNFSTGERQRMALAQCIAKQSSILILDEAMSGLPKEMEQTVFRNIQPLFEQIFFVSHREHMHGFAETLIELETRR